MGRLGMPEAGTQRSAARVGSGPRLARNRTGGPESGQRVSSECHRKRGEWRRPNGGWRRPPCPPCPLRNSRNLYLNETAPRWENHSHPARPRRPCFALASRHKSLAQTAPPARATNLRIKANRVPPHGFVQEPVPERPERLAVKPSSAPALRVQASSFSLPHARPLPVKSGSGTSSVGQWSPEPPGLCDRGSPSPRSLASHVESCGKPNGGVG
jgi:hypothetical protein